MQNSPSPPRFIFWCTAPFLVATIVLLPILTQPPDLTGWIAIGAVSLLCALTLLGLWNGQQFWWCWRAVGAIIFSGYLIYLVAMISAGDWFGDGRRSAMTVLNALIGLAMFGYPGLMYAVFGRLTWSPEQEDEDYTDESDEFPELDDVGADPNVQ